MLTVGTVGGTNSNLHGAKRAKNDEFYTQLADIEAEVGHYWSMTGKNRRNPFEGKTVYLNCDDPAWSNFWRYFALNFEHLKIGRLIATHFEADGSSSYAMFLERDPATGLMVDLGKDGSVPNGRIQPLLGNGDFRSPECVALLDESDIVVTNPPFSLYRDYVAQLVEHGKQFLIVGDQNKITYKEIFPFLKCGVFWLGFRNGDMAFKVPSDSEARETRYWVDADGQKWRSLGNTCWFTNMDHLKRHEEQQLYRYYEGNESEYPTYANYDAINVDKVKDIPADYAGVMGVPITFLNKHNPLQFEIVKFRHGNDGSDLRYSQDGTLVTPFFRILIRNLNPQPKIKF